MLKMKYVWTLALVALCVTAVSVAFAAESWDCTAKTLPTELAWDGTSTGSVTATNDSGATWAKANYQLWSVEGVTNPWSITQIDRWGLEFKALTADVPSGGHETFSLALKAPPLSGAFECDWVLAHVLTATAAIETDLAESLVVVRRFPDILPSTAEPNQPDEDKFGWASIEACAAVVPFIAAGFDDGKYYPKVTVTRAQMAAFVRRAMNIPQVDWVDPGTFSDVGEDFWAVGDIEALAADDATPSGPVVTGYGDGSYQPTWAVLRGQMAKFLAIGTGIPEVEPDPENPTFYDVSADYPGAVYIESCAAVDLVKGYADYYGEGLDGYLPTWSVQRDQMAKFCDRAFIEPAIDAGPVIMCVGGPGLSALDPELTAFDGVSTVLVDPDFAWVAFDPVLLEGFTPSDGGTVDWDIEFNYYLLVAGTPSETAVTAGPAAAITAVDLADLSGINYFYVSSTVPALTAGKSYQLRVSVEDADGIMAKLSRRVVFSIPALP